MTSQTTPNASPTAVSDLSAVYARMDDAADEIIAAYNAALLAGISPTLAKSGAEYVYAKLNTLVETGPKIPCPDCPDGGRCLTCDGVGWVYAKDGER